MNVEDLQERRERLSATGRTSEFDRILTSFGQATRSTAASPSERTESEGAFNALAMLLVDSTLDGDEPALEFAFEQLQHCYGEFQRADEPSASGFEDSGRLLALIDVAKWALERVMPLDLLVEFEVSSHAHDLLRAIAENPGATNTVLVDEFDLDPAQVSRIGNRLEQSGMARKRRVGRFNLWEITPRGVQALGILDAGGIARPKREHRQLQT
jgi:DNA-binding MarR family transcriptional regulator